MHVFKSLELLKKTFATTKIHVALGNFDGVHVGHRALISGAVSSAKKMNHKSAVVTFDPHPSQFFAKSAEFKKIDNSNLRRQLLADLGVDAVLELKFDEHLAEMSAHDFLEEMTGEGNVFEICVGADFRFGKSRQGDAKFLRDFCQSNGVRPVIMDPVLVDGVVASSSQVRKWLREGRLDLANKMLGRYFTVVGEVAHGDKVGRQLGFPTANITYSNQILPKDGVYVGTLKVRSDISSQIRANDRLACVVNIGTRPTLTSNKVGTSVEAHIYEINDSSFDLYGQQVELRLMTRLRDEMKFPGLTELANQIKADIQLAKDKLIGLAGD